MISVAVLVAGIVLGVVGMRYIYSWYVVDELHRELRKRFERAVRKFDEDNETGEEHRCHDLRCPVSAAHDCHDLDCVDRLKPIRGGHRCHDPRCPASKVSRHACHDLNCKQMVAKKRRSTCGGACHEEKCPYVGAHKCHDHDCDRPSVARPRG